MMEGILLSKSSYPAILMEIPQTDMKIAVDSYIQGKKIPRKIQM